MQSQAAQTQLTVALGASGHELVSLVGSGGKSTALLVLAEELGRGGSAVATTTTMMLARQLTAAGPLLLEGDAAEALVPRVAAALRGTPIVALAAAHAPGDKVKGVPPATVDALWDQHVADAIVVEADGSRGLPLKAFGVAEPQLPSRTTIAVVLAGLDALGVPLDEDHVHRAGLLAPILGAAPGEPVTSTLVGRALALQVARVRGSAPQAAVVVLLNKADQDESAEQAAAVADALLAASAADQAARPDRIVAGSLLQRTYQVVHA
jgi:probable selenium-dependent hydroxylase accessory protein YqeC